MLDGMRHDPQPYATVLAGNIAAQRTRMRLKQSDLAERMRQQGWKWFPQTVSEVEAGRRAIRADELLGLAVALETTPPVLVTLPAGMAVVALPSGEPVGASRLITPDQSFVWDGNRLKTAPSTRSDSLIEALIAERRREGKTQEAVALEAYRDQLGQPPEDLYRVPGPRRAARHAERRRLGKWSRSKKRS
jgi:transcriptional regulator with XRE-family HTH domain